MNLINEFKSLNELRQYHLWSMFFGKTLNTAIVIVTTIAVFNTFGAEGMVIKNQLVALYSLILLIPSLAGMAGKSPVKSLKIVFFFEVLSMGCFLFAGMEFHSIYFLPAGLLLLNTTNLFMKSLIAQVNSIVVSGCAEFCNIQTRIDSICTVIGAAIGLLFVYLELTALPIVTFSFTMLLFCRYYRFKSYYLIFGENDEVKASEISLKVQTQS